MHNRTIKSLQWLRGVCTLMVFIHHYSFKTAWTESMGDCSVAVFFMISGFVLTVAWLPRVNNGFRQLPFEFAFRHYKRFYPLYLLTLLLAVVIGGFKTGVFAFMADFLLLQSWIPAEGVYFSGNAPAWFLSSLFLCYLLFLPLLRIFRTKKNRILYIVSTGFLIIYILFALFIPREHSLWFFYIFPPMQLPVFVIGICLGRLYAEGCLKSVTPQLVLPLALALWIVSMWAWRFVPQSFALSFMWWIPSALLIWSLAVSEHSTSKMAEVFRFKPMVWFGNVSFAFYLLHMPVINLFNRIVTQFGVEISVWAGFFVCFAVTLLISPVFNKLRI